MKMEPMDLNSPSGESNQIAAKGPILEASPNLFSPSEKAVEGIPIQRKACIYYLRRSQPERRIRQLWTSEKFRIWQRSARSRHYSTNLYVSAKGRLGRRNLQPLRRGDYRLNTSWQNLLFTLTGAEEREADDVYTSGLSPVCQKGAKPPNSGNPGGLQTHSGWRTLLKKIFMNVDNAQMLVSRLLPCTINELYNFCDPCCLGPQWPERNIYMLLLLVSGDPERKPFCSLWITLLKFFHFLSKILHFE